MWVVKATDAVISKSPYDSFEGEMYYHSFVDNHALVRHHACLQFFLQRGFENVTPPGWSKAFPDRMERATIMRFGAIGDLLMITPALKALRRKFPNLYLALLARPDSMDIVFYNPYISKYTSCLYHQVPYSNDLNDMVWDLTQSIEENPIAEIENAYDVTFDWLSLDRLPASEMLPEIFFHASELSKATETLSSLGILKGDAVVAIHTEASSDRRTWPGECVIELAEKLAGSGFVIFMIGKKPKFRSVCDGKRILSLIDEYSLREVTALLRQAPVKLLIAPDSSFEHIGAALKLKLLLLYGSFDPYTRVKYFRNCHVIYKKFRCSPCHLHGNVCKFGSPAPCMANIKVEEVFDAAISILGTDPELRPVIVGKSANGEEENAPNKAEGKKESEIEDKSPKESNFLHSSTEFKKLEFDERDCPICNGKDRKMMKRYGAFVHSQCVGCGHIYTHGSPNGNCYDDEHYFDIYKTDGLIKHCIAKAEEVLPTAGRAIFPAGGEGTVLDIGCGVCAFLNRAKELGWKTQGIDISKKAIEYAIEHYALPGLTVGDFESDDKQWKDKSVDLIYMSHVQEHFADPIKAFTKAKMILKDNGLFFIATPDASQCTGRGWGHFNTFFAGEHTNIFSPKSLEILCEKVGLEIVSFKRVEPAFSFEAWLRKK